MRSEILLKVSAFSILFLYFGISTTEAYYHFFGVKYQHVGIPYEHIVFRGLLLFIRDPVFILIYGFLLSLIVFDYLGLRFRCFRTTLNNEIVFYTAFLALLIGGYYRAYEYGKKAAIQDLYVSTTSLRELISFESEDELSRKHIGRLKQNGRPILIVARLQNRLILVQEPSLEASEPRVAVHQVGVGNNDIITDKVAFVK